MADAKQQPAAAVAVIIKRGHSLLLSRRQNIPQRNSWQCAGGYLQAGESVLNVAQRCAAQTGVQISKLIAGPYTNNLFNENSVHSVSLYLMAQHCEGEAAADWSWHDWQHLPQPLFLPLQLLCDQHHGWLQQMMRN